MASAAAIGEVLDALTPVHRSPAALRLVVAAGADVAGFVAAVLAELRGWRAGVALATGACVVRGAEVTTGVVARLDVTTRAAGAVLLRVPAAFVDPLVRALTGSAPLVEAEADDVVALAVAVLDGAGAAVAAGASVAAGAVTTTGAGVCEVTGEALPATGGSVGVCGVPKPDGVHAHASATPTTPTLSTENRAMLKIRARLFTTAPSSG